MAYKMKVTIRPVELSDAATVQHYASDERLAPTCNVPHPYPEGGGQWFVRRCAEARASRERFPSAVLVDGEFAGIVGLNAPDFEKRTIECDYWIGVPFWSKGIGTAAVGLAISYAFTDLDMQTVFSGCLPSNPASARVLEKNGFMEIETIVNDGQYGQKSKGEPIRRFHLTKQEWMKRNTEPRRAGDGKAAHSLDVRRKKDEHGRESERDIHHRI